MFLNHNVPGEQREGHGASKFCAHHDAGENSGYGE